MEIESQGISKKTGITVILLAVFLSSVITLYVLNIGHGAAKTVENKVLNLGGDVSLSVNSAPAKSTNFGSVGLTIKESSSGGN
ncbi:MAG TPA: hypothetical protein VI564_05335 [Candidatus Nanoarchaeia archaeon]|nr:hypothetical protein [Candidatus Nanoarchaeia archaeon]